jgi:hypothetical protein
MISRSASERGAAATSIFGRIHGRRCGQRQTSRAAARRCSRTRLLANAAKMIDEGSWMCVRPVEDARAVRARRLDDGAGKQMAIGTILSGLILISCASGCLMSVQDCQHWRLVCSFGSIARARSGGMVEYFGFATCDSVDCRKTCSQPDKVLRKGSETWQCKSPPRPPDPMVNPR